MSQQKRPLEWARSAWRARVLRLVLAALRGSGIHLGHLCVCVRAVLPVELCTGEGSRAAGTALDHAAVQLAAELATPRPVRCSADSHPHSRQPRSQCIHGS